MNIFRTVMGEGQRCNPAVLSADQPHPQLPLTRDEAGFKIKQNHLETLIPIKKIMLIESRIKF